MKKLFFVAALAIVAVGGAVSGVNAQYFAQGQSTQLPCAIDDAPTCATNPSVGLPQSTNVYLEPAPTQTTLAGTLSDFSYTGE